MLAYNARLLNSDPTRTVLIRRSAEAEIRRRFGRVRNLLVIERDDVQRAIAGFVGDWREHIERAYMQGARRSWTDVNILLPQGRLETIARRDQFLIDLMPTIRRDIEQLNSRLHTELLNVASNTHTRINRIVSDNLPLGETRRLVREEINKGIRAGQRVVRTEIIRAHAKGQLAALGQSGVARVGIKVEWVGSGLGVTAKGHPSPCPICSAFIGKIFDIENANGLIPAHPNCLCSFSPILEPTPEELESRGRVRRILARGRRRA